MSQQIFLSYSREDSSQASELRAVLEEAGHEVWLDTHDVRGGDQWTAAIVAAIEQADSVVVLLSRSSVASEHVRTEVQLARDRGKRIVPMRLDSSRLTGGLSYSLSGLHTIKYTSPRKTRVPQLLRALDPADTQSGQPDPVPPWLPLAEHLRWATGGLLIVVVIAIGALVLWPPGPEPPAPQARLVLVDTEATQDNGVGVVDIKVQNDGDQAAFIKEVEFTIEGTYVLPFSGGVPSSNTYDVTFPHVADLQGGGGRPDHGKQCDEPTGLFFCDLLDPPVVHIEKVDQSVDPAGPEAIDRFTIRIGTSDYGRIQSYLFSLRLSYGADSWTEPSDLMSLSVTG